jgi:hypothetical protein
MSYIRYHASLARLADLQRDAAVWRLADEAKRGSRAAGSSTPSSAPTSSRGSARTSCFASDAAAELE